MILLVDNYDSFVFNLRRYLMRLGQEVVVSRNDQVPLDLIDAGDFEAIVISPGPKSPNEAGSCLELVRRFYQRVPILGVCLGHQAIWQALGGELRRARSPMHGRTSKVHYTAGPIFNAISNPFVAARYHSLAAASDSHPELQATAWSEDGEIMAFEHPQFPVYGWQFHPESILTQCGYQLLSNFLHLARVAQPPTELPPLDLIDASVSDSFVVGIEALGDSVSTADLESAPIAVLPGAAWF